MSEITRIRVRKQLKRLAHDIVYNVLTPTLISVVVGRRPVISVQREYLPEVNRFYYAVTMRPNYLHIGDDFLDLHVLHYQRCIFELYHLFPLHISEVMTGDPYQQTYLVQCANEIENLKILDGETTLVTRRVYKPAELLEDWFGDIANPTTIGRRYITFMFVFDSEKNGNQLLAMNLLAQAVLGSYFLECVDLTAMDACDVDRLDTCFRRWASIYANDRDTILAGSMAFQHADEDMVTNDDEFIDRIAYKVANSLYATDDFFSNAVIVSPNLAEPFPLGTRPEDFTRPLTNPPELQPPSPPTPPPSPIVDTQLREKVIQVLDLERRGLYPAADAQPLVDELHRQEIAAGVPLTRPMSTLPMRITAAALGGRRGRKVSKSPRRRRSRSRKSSNSRRPRRRTVRRKV